MYLKKGDIGANVVKLQELLNQHGFNLQVDGIFGAQTENAVLAFQKREHLAQDGIVGRITWAELAKLQQLDYHKPFSLLVDQYIAMQDNEFVKEKTTKTGITYHHTVSDGNPAAVVNSWEHDKRGPVGTHFVIGRTMVNGDTRHDGKIVQCIPMDFWAHHILTTRMGFNNAHNEAINKRYIGIELCSWGALEKKGDKFFTLDGRVEIPADQVCVLRTPFRTYQYWHKFTTKQLTSLYQLTTLLIEHCNIDVRVDIQGGDWFELSWEALALRRKLTTHTNFEYGKFDTFPQPELKNMINSVYHYNPDQDLSIGDKVMPLSSLGYKNGAKIYEGDQYEIKDIHVCDICGQLLVDVGFKTPKMSKGIAHRPSICICKETVEDGSPWSKTGTWWIPSIYFRKIS